jgi:hypothetical protein
MIYAAGKGSLITIAGFNFKAQGASIVLDRGLGDTTGLVDPGVSVSEHCVNKCSGNFSGIVYDAAGATIQGVGSSVTLAGMNFGVQSWGANFAATVIHTTLLTDSWYNCQPTWIDCEVSISGLAQGDAVTVPAAQWTVGEHKIANAVLTGAAGCTINIPQLSCSTFSWGRQAKSGTPFTLTARTYGLFSLTWAANMPLPTGSIDGATGFAAATWGPSALAFKYYDSGTGVTRTMAGNVVVPSLSLMRVNTQGAFMSYSGSYVSAGAITCA